MAIERLAQIYVGALNKQKRHPTGGVDGEPLPAKWHRCAGKDLAARGTLLGLSMDWEAKNLTLGVKSWSSVHTPCPDCGCSRETMHSYARAPIPQRTHEDWQVARDLCTKIISPSLAEAADIQSPPQMFMWLCACIIAVMCLRLLYAFADACLCSCMLVCVP